jgi:cysteine synthase A
LTSPDFVAKLTGDAVSSKVIFQVLRITSPDAMRCSKELAKKEGIFFGITSGGTFAGALQVAEQAPKGATILCMLPDTGERYQSTPLFADVSPEMNEEEREIARSTPGCILEQTK